MSKGATTNGYCAETAQISRIVGKEFFLWGIKRSPFVWDGKRTLFEV